MDMQEYFISLIFQPTPSSRRATAPPLGERHQHLRISTHALLAEGDTSPEATAAIAKLFQPTPSSRRAT